MTTYGYLRVSTHLQDEENQKQGVVQKATSLQLNIDRYFTDKVSGVTKIEDRQLGRLLRRIKKDDIIIVAELSRLARKITMLFKILEIITEKQAQLYSVKEGFTLDDSITSKALMFAFGLSAEIERNLISARTKEALERKRAEGVKLGRPVGSKTKVHKLDCYKERIARWLKNGRSRHWIAKRCGVVDKTLRKYLLTNI